MFKNSWEMDTEIRERMREGNGSVELVNVFSREELKGKCRLFSKITLNPGCSIGTHSHEREEEIYYVISGKGIVDDNGILRDIAPGDALKTGGGECHSISNNGAEPLVFLAAILLFD